MKDKVPIGWREWVELPDLAIPRIKAKIDTGARSSSLHAYDITYINRRGRDFVEFKVHPAQRSLVEVVQCRTPLVDIRRVRSSIGKVQNRPLISTTISVNGIAWSIELTLSSRDEMGFRMLLGREAIRGRFVVDPGRSFLLKERGSTLQKRRRRQ